MSEERKDIDCSIVKDLLPLYIDGLTSVETGSYINKHLRTCESCRKAYEAMKTELLQEETESKAKDTKEIDYLKKTKKKQKNLKILAGLFIAAACILGFILYNSLHLFEIDGSLISVESYSRVENTLTLNGVISSSYAPVKTTVEQDGSTVTLHFYSRKASKVNTDASVPFSESIEIPEGVTTVCLEDRIVYDHDTAMDRAVSLLYQLKTDTLNEESVQKILDFMNGEWYEAPVEINGSDIDFNLEEFKTAQAEFETYAARLFALVPSLEKVTFHCRKDQVESFTRSEITELLGEDPSIPAKTAAGFQEICDRMNIHLFTPVNLGDYPLTVTLENDTEEDFTSVFLSCTWGTLYTSKAIGTLPAGESRDISFESHEEETPVLSLTVENAEKGSYTIPVNDTLSAKGTYRITIIETDYGYGCTVSE